MDLGAALLALFTGLIVKVAVMVLGGWLLVRLYQATHGRPRRLWLLLPQEDLPEVKLLYASLVLFAVAELTCGIEVYVLFHCSPWLSGIHSVTSAAGMGLFSLGLYLFLDKRLLRYGQRACLVNRICRGCTIEEPVGCRYRSTLMLGATFVALAALAPFFAPAEQLNADPRRWVLPFESWNTWYDTTYVPWLQDNVAGYEPTSIAYWLPEAMMVIEYRVLPAVALVVALTAIPLARAGREPLAGKLVVFAAGMLAYSYFELVLYRVTGDVYVGSLGHELVEFWFLVAVAELLRRTFPPDREQGASVTEAQAPAEPRGQPVG